MVGTSTVTRSSPRRGGDRLGCTNVSSGGGGSRSERPAYWVDSTVFHAPVSAPLAAAQITHDLAKPRLANRSSSWGSSTSLVSERPATSSGVWRTSTPRRNQCSPSSSAAASTEWNRRYGRRICSSTLRRIQHARNDTRHEVDSSSGGASQ